MKIYVITVLWYSTLAHSSVWRGCVWVLVWSPVSGAALCALLTQDRELNYACGLYDGRGSLEDVQSAIKSGADPNWKDPDMVSLHQLVHSQCCVSSVVSDHVVV